MEYNRSFIIQSCHFNDNRTYDRYHSALLASREEGQGEEAFAALLSVLRDTHGHNFDISITAHSADLVDSDCERGLASWVVADEMLRDMVAEWDNTNLSVHPDFVECRATTENMATILARKLGAKVPEVEFVVVVCEHPDVSATAVYSKNF